MVRSWITRSVFSQFELNNAHAGEIFVGSPFFCGLFGLVSHDDDSTSDLRSVCFKGRILESLLGVKLEL